MGRLDNTPQPVREAISAALMIGAVTATAATLLHQPLFLFGGLVLFAIFYIWRINPQVKAAYIEQEENEARYADDKTYEPILARFDADGNDDALIEGLSQNQEFFTMLLNNDEVKRSVLGIFLHDVYQQLREGE